jgi:hypothetical protein
VILQRLAEVFRKRKWADAAFELAVVAVGILMAFQVDRWWEARRDIAAERDYVRRLIVDLRKDVEELAHGVALAELRRDLTILLMDAADDPDLAIRRPAEFIIAIDQSAYTFTPALTANTFEELRSTGRLGLLRNDEIRNGLYDYYRFDESERQYQSLQLMQEVRHFERAAGIVDHQMARDTKDRWGIVDDEGLNVARQESVNPEAVRAAVERFVERDEFIAWLPISYEMQIDAAQMNAERQTRAQRLIEQLRSHYGLRPN